MSKPHLLYLAWGFPPAAKSCTYRMLATANSFSRAGWDVTVLTLSEDAWVREHGLDDSLLQLVDPRSSSSGCRSTATTSRPTSAPTAACAPSAPRSG